MARKLARFGMGEQTRPKRRLSEVYKYPGFRPRATIGEVEGAAGTLIVSLDRRSKKRIAAAAARRAEAGTTVGAGACATWAVAAIGWFWSSRRDVWTVVAVAE